MWDEKKTPPRIEKRFEFESYKETSDFMEKIESLCKEKKIFPNISFGGKFASITIFYKSKKISEEEKIFSNDIDIQFEKIKKIN